jgi:hypothetical protein
VAAAATGSGHVSGGVAHKRGACGCARVRPFCPCTNARTHPRSAAALTAAPAAPPRRPPAALSCTKRVRHRGRRGRAAWARRGRGELSARRLRRAARRPRRGRRGSAHPAARDRPLPLSGARSAGRAPRVAERRNGERARVNASQRDRGAVGSTQKGAGEYRQTTLLGRCVCVRARCGGPGLLCPLPLVFCRAAGFPQGRPRRPAGTDEGGERRYREAADAQLPWRGAPPARRGVGVACWRRRAGAGPAA